MRNILVIFGGESYEHDISILSAIQCMGYLDDSNNKIIPCYITRNGEKFIKPRKPLNAHSYVKNRVKGCKIAFGNQCVKYGLTRVAIDCALVVCHGGKGENGALSGMLEMYNIPYTTGEPTALGICMNKAKTHENCSKIDIKCADYVLLRKEKSSKTFELQFRDNNASECRRGLDADDACDIIIRELGCELIVKPNNLGSSIGVATADSIAELKDAVFAAFELDGEVIVEKRIGNLVEYNCACMRFNGDYIVSEIERPISADKILDFNAKYMQNGKMSGVDREFPADIDENLRERIMSATLKAYVGLGLKGIVRIDYLYDRIKGELYLNEVNAVPGSLAYYLFDISPSKLFNMAINEGISTYNAQKLYERQYRSDVLNTYGKGCKSVK